jgi:hypothetical protein
LKPKLPSKPVIGLVTIAIVALATWSFGLVLGTAILGKEGWSDWRHAHSGLYFLIWGASVVVITLPLLWLIGTRMAARYEEEEAEVAAARGVGRLAAKALQGKRDAKERLVELLDDDNVQIRCQAARALMLLSEDWTNRELERKIRYWPGNDKVALIENLRSTRDMRATWLLEMLAEDRNPVIARRARSALVHVTPETTRLDESAQKRKAKDERRAEKKGLRPAGAAAGKTTAGGATVVPAGKIDKREAPPKRSTPLKQTSAETKKPARPRPPAEPGTARPAKPAAPARKPAEAAPEPAAEATPAE